MSRVHTDRANWVQPPSATQRAITYEQAQRIRWLRLQGETMNNIAVQTQIKSVDVSYVLRHARFHKYKEELQSTALDSVAMHQAD